MATSNRSQLVFRIGLLPAAAAAAMLLMPAGAIAGGQGNGQYFARRDTIALGAGDAPQTNITTHTIDPWPPYSKNYNLRFDGDRMLLGISRYKANQSIEPEGLTTQTILGEGSSGQGGGPPPVGQ